MTVSLTGLTITGGKTGNNASGGGIENFGTVANLTNDVVVGNTGGGGGGIANRHVIATLTDDTITGNTTTVGGGGGLSNDGTIEAFSNDTISGNHAAHNGGGVQNGPGAVITTLSQDTITGNTPGDGTGGGILNIPGGHIRVANTIVADNPGRNCLGSITDGGNNLENGTSCRFVNHAVNAEPGLEPLQNNGGPTPTQAILETSPAFARANDSVCGASPVSNKDQRGLPRTNEFPGDTNQCDIGAYETQAATLTFVGQGGDNAAYSGTIGSQGFSGLGGQVIGAPGIVSLSSPKTHLYITAGTDNQLYQSTDQIGWQRLTSARTFCFDGVGAFIDTTGTLWIGCDGGDHALWVSKASIDPTTGLAINLQGFTSFGGVLGAGPSLTRLPTSNDVWAFVVGSDRRVYLNDLSAIPGFFLNPYGWACQGHVGVANSRPNGGTYFACNGTDSHLWVSVFPNTGSGFGPTHPAGGVVVNGVGVAPGNTSMLVAVQGSDHQVWYTASDQNGNTNGFTPRGGIYETGLSASSP